MKMAKVVFCNIAWMKLYRGINEDDMPKNGGAFVKKNNDACECFNFYPYNHNFLGYVRVRGTRLDLARVEPVADDVDKIEDVTVVWTATNDTGRYIVGWYEHAEMYRYYHEFEDGTLSDKTYWGYNFKTGERNAHLIPEEMRTFKILRANQAGPGMGMGQSNLWYADSAIAKEKFVPKVLEYLEKVRPYCEQNYWTKKGIEKIADIKGKSIEELNAIAEKTETFADIITIDNLIISLNPPDMLQARFQRAVDLEQMLLYDEAIEEYQRVLACATVEDEKREVYLNCLFNLERLYELVHSYFLAWEMARRCLAKSDKIEDKFEAILCMLTMAENEQNVDLTDEALGYYDTLHTDYMAAEIKKYRKEVLKWKETHSS